MNKILPILFMCLVMPVSAYTKDLWEEGSGLIYETDYKGNYTITFDKDGSNFTMRIGIPVECDWDHQNKSFSRRVGEITGTGKLENGKVIIKTKDGSKFILSISSTYNKETQQDTIVLTVIPEISDTQKINWYKDKITDMEDTVNGMYKGTYNDVNQCQAEVQHLENNLKYIIKKEEIIGYEGD